MEAKEKELDFFVSNFREILCIKLGRDPMDKNFDCDARFFAFMKKLKSELPHLSKYSNIKLWDEISDIFNAEALIKNKNKTPKQMLKPYEFSKPITV